MTYEEIQALKKQLKADIDYAKTYEVKEKLEIELMMLEEYEAKIIARGAGILKTVEEWNEKRS